jgi:hypothetical protein
MHENKTVAAWAAGCGWQAALSLALGLAALLALVALTLVALMAPLPPGAGGQAALPALMGAFVVLALAATTVAVVWMLYRRALQLDAAFEPLGLSGRGYLANGRQYHGTLYGRQVDVYFYRGPALDIYLSTPVAARLSAGTRDRLSAGLARAFGRRPLALDDPAYAQLAVSARDEAWARRLLAEPEAQAALARLTGNAGVLEKRQVSFQPGAVQLRLSRTRMSVITSGNARVWLDDLVRLARVAESLPPPAEAPAASRLEQTMRANRDAITLPMLLVLLGVLVVLMLCAAAAAAVLMAMEGAG